MYKCITLLYLLISVSVLKTSVVYAVDNKLTEVSNQPVMASTTSFPIRPIVPDRKVMVNTVKVVWVDSIEKKTGKLYKEFFVDTTSPKYSHTIQYGFSGYAILLEDDMCIIYAEPPKHVDDRFRMEVLGHELMHCLYGAYHGK